MKNILQTLILVLITSVATAQMPVYAPTHAAPADGSNNRTPNVLLDWYPVAGATKYVVQLDTSASFTNPTILTNTYTAISSINLLFNADYYWRVAAIGNANDTSAWSTAWMFNVVDTVTLTLPISDTLVYSPDVLLDWNGINGTNAYQIQIDDDMMFTSILIDSIIDTPATKFNAYYLNYGGTYYWRVKAMHSVDTSSWSETWIVHITDRMYVESPADSAEKIHPVTELQFSGISGSDYFEYQFDTNSSFSSPTSINVHDSNLVFLNTPSVDTVVKVMSDTFMFGTTYYWRARAIHVSNNTPWSSYWMFTTLDTVDLISPADGATQIARQPTLKWDSISGVVSYDIMYDTLSNFSTATTTSSSGYSMTIFTPFEKDQTVYWKVRAHSNTDVSEWSEAYSFTTVDGVGINEDEIKNLSVYPNPTKDIVQLSVHANNMQEAQISVTNIIGQQVYNEIRSLQSGDNTIYIDLSSYNNGIYIVKCITKNASLSKKVILNK